MKCHGAPIQNKRAVGVFSYDIFALLSWFIVYKCFFLFFSVGRCVGSAATVAGLEFLELHWSREPRSRSNRWSLRSLSWNLCRFCNDSKFENFFLFCCVGGVSGTPPALLDLRFNYATLLLSWFAWYSASRRCLCRAGKATNLALLCGMDVYVSKMISLNTKIWLRKCAVFRKAHSHVHLGCFLLRWSLNSYIFLISQRT